jgi:hypothetical protein
VRTKVMVGGGEHRSFRMAVWIGRAIGWMLLLVAILGIAEAALLPVMMSGFKLLPSIALVFVAVTWIAGLELFLHFFDRYLSRN